MSSQADEEMSEDQVVRRRVETAEDSDTLDPSADAELASSAGAEPASSDGEVTEEPPSIPPSFPPRSARPPHVEGSETEPKVVTSSAPGTSSIANSGAGTGSASFVTANDAESKDAEETQSWQRTLLEIVAVVASVLLVSVVIKTFFVQAFSVPSGSMETTLQPGDKFFVNRMVKSEDEIRRGDVVVFVDPGGWLTIPAEQKNPVAEVGQKILQGVGILPADTGHYLVKRVIGKGGDHVECCTAEGRISVNGVPIDEPYLAPGISPSLEAFDVTVPRGNLWLMGDNRSNSKDSRWHQRETGNGFVPVDNVAGRAFIIFYPFDRVGKITDNTAAFANVPDPGGVAVGGQ
ncbi:signal peptidase I [Actinobaculum suis]|uniref:signal peptidase I n=1 Tax=Actinobaculum suis TaxID=1657 RepID=UPI000A70EDA1|nr:signal peptidase I [Actinobaculum suis]